MGNKEVTFKTFTIELTGDIELDAIAACLEGLKGLSQLQTQRVIGFISARSNDYELYMRPGMLQAQTLTAPGNLGNLAGGAANATK